MKSRYDHLYLLAFLLAALLRFIELGALPLTDTEANWALQALSLAQGEKVLLSGQAGYIAFTSFLFYTLESTNFLARFVPAFAGSFIVFLPYFIHKSPHPNLPPKKEGRVLSLFGGELKERTAITAAFLLAIAPGLVALSRQANGTMLALTFGAFAWGMWKNNNPKWAGLFAGVALLGGASLWMGLLGIGLSWAIGQNLLRHEDLEEEHSSPNHARNEGADLKIAAIFMGGTILLFSTRLLLSPNGISAWLNSLTNYLSGWRFASGVPITHILFGLFTYYPLALLFGIISIWRALKEKNQHKIFLALWAAIALILTLIYPARQVSDLIWAGIPLWILSAIEIPRYFRKPTYERNETLGVFALTIILLLFSWLNLASASILPGNPEFTSTHQYLLAASIGLLILSLSLIAIGWSVEIATLGGAWGIILGLTIYTLGTAWGATGLRTPKGIELWDNAPRVAQAGLLVDTVGQISTWGSGDAQSLNIVLTGVNSPALNWVLRNHDLSEVAILDSSTTPDLVISPYTEDIGLAASYRGQDFTWRKSPDWLLMNSWPKWVILREVPESYEIIILWVRNDLFFDAQN
ncbi:MAG: hypothetical protein HN392_01780 [Anaerolineae bacterium]|jgi:hypothetical protein|nr:hypothetical protein [Anaerolineae bacterium]MBT7075400.1 hypothetical protein [Anaerolineae bacterium]MBT7781418.1 hypothetical protein [Anaerolineae bacterium]